MSRQINRSGSKIPLLYVKRSQPEKSPKDIIFNWYVPMECVKKLGDVEIQDILGTGVYGSVYDVCDKNTSKCEKVVKIISLNYTQFEDLIIDYILGEITAETYLQELIRHGNYLKQATKGNVQLIEEFEHEIRMNKIASDLGVAPKMHEAFICKDVLPIPDSNSLISLGFISSDKWDITLDQYYKKYQTPVPKNIIELIGSKVNLLNDNGIIHDDIHAGNIVLNLDQNNIPTDISLIDFGLSKDENDFEYRKYSEVDKVKSLIHSLNNKNRY